MTYRSRLGEPATAADAVLSYRELFQVPHEGLRRTLDSFRPLTPEEWRVGWEENHEGGWANNCQGVTSDGDHWYISSNADGEQAIYKLDGGRLRLSKRVEIDDLRVGALDHVGDLDVYDGLLYVAIEGPHGFLTISADLDPGTARFERLPADSPQSGGVPWCAVNPWDGLLYSSDFDNRVPPPEVRTIRHHAEPRLTYEDFWERRSGEYGAIYGYDRETFEYVRTVRLERPVLRIQGGCFSENGHLLLASDAKPRLSIAGPSPKPGSLDYEVSRRGIKVFNAATGAYLGSADVTREYGPDLMVARAWYQELEGICIKPDHRRGSTRSDIHLILLENQGGDDESYFKHYSLPDPTRL